MGQDLGQLGENAAQAMRPVGENTGRAAARRTQAALRQIRAVRDHVAARAARQERTTPAWEWLLDNWYLAQREGRDGADCLRRAVRLRWVRRGGGKELFVLELARAFVGEAGAAAPEKLCAFLGRAQQARPLTEGELSVLVPALKCACVERLAGLCPRLEGDQPGEGTAQALEEIFSSLRMLSTANLCPLLEQASRVEEALRRDPAGEYAKMDDETRARYRRELCRLARKKGLSEEVAAAQVLALCEAGKGEERHVGYYLFRRPMGERPRLRSGGLYVAAVVLPTLFVTLLLGYVLHSGAVALLLLLPVSEIVKNLVDFAAVRLFRPRPVCRLELEEGIPKEGKTLCVIAGLLTGEKSGAEYAALLERYRLANRDAGEHLLFGLLADLPDRAEPMGGAARGWAEAARREIEALNGKYGGGFYLLFRPPIFHPVDEVWQGWERKRGALLELARLLRGRRCALQVRAGDRRRLQGVKFVLTLDSDTSLNVGAARELAGAMLHPLNRAVVDRRRRVVRAGYGVLQPRVGVELGAANKSQFSRIFAGQGGVDPYGSASSDVYHDLFDQGTYTGKGIFDVDAFLTCLDGRFPENRVLSHDLLEGSYLHAGLIGDVELTDGYPYKVNSYFARLHRWVRGDWQLLPWLGRTVRNQAGDREPNPISPMAKWKIFDNLRRSISPVCTLLALLLGMCLTGADFGAAAGVAVLCAASNLLLSGAELAFRGGAGAHARYHSTIIAGLGGVVLQTLVQLLFLPVHAWTCASAAVTALWRQLVTRRGLLAWVTAADAERRQGDGVWANYKKQWPAVAAGLAAMLFARFPAGAAAGLVWALSPVFAWAMSRPIPDKKSVSAADRAFLLHQGAAIWGYFADFLRPEDHWLPPDNWQEQPAVGLARRTSPTNIGMALLCCLAAADLDFISREKAAELLGHMLDTLEGLPKWRGHLFNWYDTATAQAMSPRYVSTVDGGNLCGCLIALREGLAEWGEEALAARAGALAGAMDFSLLYDRERRLFFIGYDDAKGEYTQGWYDLMASEARQTSYLAVARGEVSPRHWRRLGRMLVGENDYSGMASWTGTMFEYFMPNLLLPAEPNSAMYESLAFCVYAQRRRARRKNVPWGISESGFYAFDGAFNYQYKAHGVQRLGLKRGLDDDLVIAPYATFLALLLSPGGATQNLRRLRALGAEGKYGLYEALDYTPGRLTGERSFETVKSYMAHHLGMSLVAVDNALNGNLMQERFMRDSAMGAYRELLQEKVPVGAAVMKSPAGQVPDKPKRLTGSEPVREGHWDGTGRPACALVSNGSYTVFCTADGRSCSRMGGSALTTELGVQCCLSAPELFLHLEPDAWRFGQEAAWSAHGGALTALHTLRVPDRENGEIREITLRWEGEGELRGELACYLEPVLARWEDYRAHPAFSKLFLESAYTGDGVVFTRRHRSSADGTPALAVCWDGAGAFFDTSREIALGRGGLRAMRQALAGPAHSSAGAVLDPCLLLRVPVTLAPGESFRLRLALSASDSGEEALAGAARLLRGAGGRENGRLARLAALCKLTRNQALQAYDLLGRLALPGEPPEFDQRELWAYGISGDVPIAALAVGSREEAEQQLHRLGAHKLLTLSGYTFDLVFLLSEGGDYRRPARSALLEGAGQLDWGHKLGAKGGIHLVEDNPAVRAAATVLLGREEAPYVRPTDYEKEISFTLKPGIPRWEVTADGGITFAAGRRLPPVGWSQMLTNGSMGWMPDETGCGHLWQGNAREHQLTPWENDPLAIGGPERFYLRTGAGWRSIFADADALDCAVTYGPGYARWEKEGLRTTAFVPREPDARVLLLELEGDPGELLYQNGEKGEILYRIEGCLALATGVDGTREMAPEEARRLLNRTVMDWNRQVSALKVRTPDRALDGYLNGWALYQVIACRLLGRTSRYQNGGAYGFRDQLQDVCATLLTQGETARGQILRACAHQFLEGDVQHWWHEPHEAQDASRGPHLSDLRSEEVNSSDLRATRRVPPAAGPGKGVRTRISDDLLWLPYVLCEYLEARGDWGILTEEAPFLSSPPLGAGEQERYEQPAVSQEMGTVFDHALRAILCSLDRGTGEHGLALMGAGDWNDGMNRVGAGGRGESVWLTWFTAFVLERFAPVCERMGEGDRAEELRGLAERYASAANAAWDGEWFLRGYYDDGATLGSARDERCRIDSIAQSWAALVPHADRDLARRAVRSALEQLFDRGAGVVKLFTPAFDGNAHDPGYIRGYVPGVRENGGQYTHAAVWLALGCLRLGMAGEGWEILRALLPAHHDPAVYRAEPYVLAADVYSNPAHPGRGGWSWYTGAGGWYYRTAVGELLGLKLRGGRLFVEPALPPDWPGYTALWRTPRCNLHIQVARGAEQKALLDGEPVREGVELEALEGDRTLEVTVL